MSNLPPGTTQDMIDAQCAPIAKCDVFCNDCDERKPVAEMYAWRKWNFLSHMMSDVYLCEHCVPKCLWQHNDQGIVNLDLKPCGRIQSPNAQGPWCAEHDKEAEALDAAESEGA
jgi:hypothetical protein